MLLFARQARKIRGSLPVTAAFSGAVIGLEFAPDRFNIGDGILYLIYLLLGLHMYRKQEKLYRQEQAIRA